MDTEKIELGENWWEVKAKLTVGSQRASEEHSADYITGEGTIEDEMARIPAFVKFEMSRAMIFASTVAWSYGEVTKEVFNNEVPSSDYNIVLLRCNELYSSSPLVKTGETSQKP